ncbi:MAG: DMT family transporter [Planctomycetes bacterium]|nr:DMT family transporter [Planctomycetota bacterium]
MSTFDFILLFCCAIAAGVAVTIQPALNAALATKTALPHALIVNTMVVLACTICYYIYYKLGGGGGAFFPGNAAWYLYIGGVGGFIVILTTAYVFPRIGVAYAIALLVLGQGVAALAVDHYGFLGMARREFSPARAAGIALVAGGIVLLRK